MDAHPVRVSSPTLRTPKNTPQRELHTFYLVPLAIRVLLVNAAVQIQIQAGVKL
jgi:hypothetical protein